MASKKVARRKGAGKAEAAPKVRLKKGDLVMVIGGGNSKKRPNKGKVGRILGFAGDRRERVLVEGVNMLFKLKRQMGPGKPGGRIQREGSIHISNVMYYAEKIKKPVRLRYRFLEDGTKVRGYFEPGTKAAQGEEPKFVQI